MNSSRSRVIVPLMLGLLALGGIIFFRAYNSHDPSLSPAKDIRPSEGGAVTKGPEYSVSKHTPVDNPASVTTDDARLRLNTLLSHLLALDALSTQRQLSNDEVRKIHSLRHDFSVLAWSNPGNLEMALGLAEERAHDAKVLGILETALAVGAVNGVELMKRASLDQESTTNVVQMYLRHSANAPLARLLLAVLRNDLNQKNERITQRHDFQDPSYLDAQTVSTILNGVIGTKDELAIEHALYLAGNFTTTTPEIRAALERLALTSNLSRRVRLAAIASYRGATITPERLTLAKTLLRTEQDPSFRNAALKLLVPSYDGPQDSSLMESAENVLTELVRTDSDQRVRLEAADALINTFESPKTFVAVSQVLADAKDPKLRTAILDRFELAYIGNRSLNYKAQDLMTSIFQNDTEDAVRRSALRAYTGLMTRTIVDEEGTLDTRTLIGLQKMASVFVETPPSSETKAFLKNRLETKFEKTFPDLRKFEEYLAFKRLLDQ